MENAAEKSKSDGGSPEITVLPEPSGIKSHVLKISERKRFYYGGLSLKQWLTAEMGDKKQITLKRLRLVERDFGKKTNRIVKIYTAYKKAGLPVVHTFRKTTEGKVVMTDVTADGSRIYGKAVSIHHIGSDGEKRSPDPMDAVFLEFMNNKEVVAAIKTEAERIAMVASENGIVLAWDDPFELIIHPDKTWNLLCLDLEQALYNPVDQQDAFSVKRNLSHVRSFGIALQRARLALSYQNTHGVSIENIFEGEQH